MASLLFALWFFRAVRSTLLTTHWWQIKEYRWDRMRTFLSSPQARSVFFSSYHLLVLGVLVAYLFTSHWKQWPTWLPLAVGVVFLAECLQGVLEVFHRQLRRPKFTVKAGLIVMVSLAWEVCLVLVFAGFPTPSASATLMAAVLGILMLLGHDLNALLVAAFTPLTGLLRRRIFEKARNKRRAMRELLVVGITGSYGKSSVKEFAAQLLGSKFKVLKTDKNVNTEIGVAKTILHQLTEEHEVFVCEMGAYKRGEIAKICSFAQPTIGVLTGINEQHLALFGSRENILQGKWELMDALPLNGFAVFNGDSEPLRKRLELFAGQKTVCSLEAGENVPTELEVLFDRVKFRLEGHRIEAPLLGKFSVLNLTMAIAVARHLGVKWPDIIRVCKTLVAPERTMTLKPFDNGYVIDDSYNTNTDGFKAALEHLQLFEGHRRVVVFPGILELGSEAGYIHDELGELAANSTDELIITAEEQAGPLAAGALRGGLTRHAVKTIFDPKDLATYVEKFRKGEKSVILFESRGGERAMAALLKT